QCDDTDTEVRIFVEGTKENKKPITFWANGSSGVYLSKSRLREWGYKAWKEKKEEYPLDGDWKWKDYDNTIHGWALVDVPKRRVYGIKVQLQTTTSTVTSSFLIPPPPEDD